MSKDNKIIIINAYQHADTVTGTDRMAYNFLRELQVIDRINKYHVVCSNEHYTRSVIKNDNFHILKPPIVKNKLIQRLSNKFWRTLLPLGLIRYRADVYFSVHNMRLPKLRIARKMIASNLDLIPLKLDEYAQILGKSRKKIYKEMLSVCKLADYFVSISGFSKQELCKAFSVADSKVLVIPLAVDNNFLKSNMPKSKSVYPSAKFILTIGGSEPRKNVKEVVEAYRLLPMVIRSEYTLAIAGGDWHGRSLGEFKANENIKALGQISDTDLLILYKTATLFVFASKYEGFGFTILEAMAQGTPVLSSSSSSLPEVGGTAVEYFDNSKVLVNKLQRILTDKKILGLMSVASKKRAGDFSWSSSAKKLHTLFISD